MNPRGARRPSNMYVGGEPVSYYVIEILNSKTVAAGICGLDPAKKGEKKGVYLPISVLHFHFHFHFFTRDGL